MSELPITIAEPFACNLRAKNESASMTNRQIIELETYLIAVIAILLSPLLALLLIRHSRLNANTAVEIVLCYLITSNLGYLWAAAFAIVSVFGDIMERLFGDRQDSGWASMNDWQLERPHHTSYYNARAATLFQQQEQ